MLRGLLLSTVIVMFGLTTLSAGAQTGALKGTVVDTNGDSLVAVRVSLTTPSSENPFIKLTDSSGAFSFEGLVEGVYAVECSTEGLKTILIKDVKVTAGETVALELKMEVEAAPKSE